MSRILSSNTNYESLSSSSADRRRRRRLPAKNHSQQQYFWRESRIFRRQPVTSRYLWCDGCTKNMARRDGREVAQCTIIHNSSVDIDIDRQLDTLFTVTYRRAIGGGGGQELIVHVTQISSLLIYEFFLFDDGATASP